MHSTSTIVKWQPILYFLRFPLLMINFILCASHYRPAQMYLQCRQLVYYSAVLALLVCGCVNDLYMLTWDIYTCGSFLAHAIPQILISLALVSILTLETVWIYNMWKISIGYDPTIISKLALTRELLSVVLSLLISVFIVIAAAVFWMQSSSCRRTRDVRWTLFGTKRPANDEARRLVRKVWTAIKRLPRWPKNIIYRRIVDIESTQYALTRNVVAIILLSLLVAQSVILIHGVIYEDFDTREVWRVPIILAQPPDFCDFTLIPETDANQAWSLFSTFSSSADHVTSIIPSTPATCEDSGQNGISFCQPMNNTCGIAQADILDIAMISDLNSSSMPERIWVEYNEYPVKDLVPDSITARLYDHGIHFMPGYQLSGLVTFAERRIIQSHFSDMWGLKPNYCHHVIPSIDWMQSTPLNNESVAWVTLRFNTPERYYGHGKSYIRVIEDYRQHTFLSALSSIGGLLSVLQGLHILCFGKPLFWGMFGSKLLDPFGIFACGSRALRERMAARYGFDTESRTFSAEGLSLFLRDFVLDIGPLDDKGNDDYDEDDSVENEKEECRPTTAGATQACDTISPEGVARPEDDRCSIHVGDV